MNKMWNIYRDASDATQGFRDKVDGWLKRDAGSSAEPEDLGARRAPVAFRDVEGQYVAYSFYRVVPEWRRLPVDERAGAEGGVRAGARRLRRRASSTSARTSTTGVRPETDFFLWKITERYDDLGELGAALNGTELAGWLETPYSYLATTKASQYTSARKARKITPHGLPYLVVYPFIKVRPWYALAEDDRQRAMDEHILSAARSSPASRTTRRTRSASTTRSS